MSIPSARLLQVISIAYVVGRDMSLAAVLCRDKTGIILHKGNLCEELVSTVTVLDVCETVGIRRAGPAAGPTCNVRFETVRLGPESRQRRAPQYGSSQEYAVRCTLCDGRSARSAYPGR